MGYNAKIQTPVGIMCGVYADYASTNRPFLLIEKHIQSDIKPLIANHQVSNLFIILFFKNSYIY